MWHIIWPIALVVLANLFYHICSKSTPGDANAFLSLCVTYLIAAVASFALFVFTGQTKNLINELSKLNWASFALGMSIVALEFGYICAYRSGWKISVGSLVANIVLACALVFVGLLLFKEKISIRQIIGIAVCILGLFLINK
ncbi:MAG TPA: EamA family transporter [Clostridiales bacterium]|nr:EamA family transporter [Clostridiales bacterium]